MTGRLERLKDAIEGECDGLAITDENAQVILDYVFTGDEAGYRQPLDIQAAQARVNLSLLAEAIRGKRFDAIITDVAAKQLDEADALIGRLAGLDDDAVTATIPARDGIEAQYGLNDVFPGDPYPVAREPLPSPKQMQAACDRFNERHAVGDTIHCWTGPREGEPVERRIKYPACVMSGHTAVVYVYGAGSIALTHVKED